MIDKRIFESSLVDLYKSTTIAYPLTTLRQHATDPIKITNIRWTPFVGVHTLFVKGLAQSEGAEYNTIILFKNVNYNLNEIKLSASDGGIYTLGKLSLETNDVAVRCNCLDMKFRFSYFLSLDHSLFGRKPKKYIRVKGSNRPPINQKSLPGLCKHVIKLIEVLEQANLFK
jgi:hypothetical protein